MDAFTHSMDSCFAAKSLGDGSSTHAHRRGGSIESMVPIVFFVCILVETMMSTVAGKGFVHKASAATASRVGIAGIVFSVVEICLLLYMGFELFDWTLGAFMGGSLSITPGKTTAVVPFILFSCILSINLLINSIMLNYHSLPYSTIYVGGFILMLSRVLLLVGLVCHLCHADETNKKAMFYKIVLGMCLVTTLFVWFFDTIMTQIFGWLAIVVVLGFGIYKITTG